MTAQQAYAMLDNQTLWQIAERVNELLSGRGIDYTVVGGVAVCLHGYRRNTVHLDLLVRPASVDELRAALQAGGLA